MIHRCLLDQTMRLAAETTLMNLRYTYDKQVLKKILNWPKTELAKEISKKSRFISTYFNIQAVLKQMRATSTGRVDEKSGKSALTTFCSMKLPPQGHLVYAASRRLRFSAIKNWVWILILEILSLPLVRMMILIAWKMHSDLRYLLLTWVQVKKKFLLKF